MSLNAKAVRPFLLAALAYLLILQTALFLRGLPKTLAGDGDFPAFYRAAVIMKSRQCPKLYDPATQERVERELFPVSAQQRAPQYFYHPPYEVLLFLPLAFLSYRAAFWWWTVIGIVLITLSAHALRARLECLRAAVGVPLAFVFASFFPVLLALLLGQDSLLLFLIVALAFRQYSLGRDTMCGLLLGLGLFKFQLVLPLAAIGFSRRGKLYASLGVTALALVGLSWFLIGSEGLRAYWRLLWHHAPEEVWRMPNLRGFIETSASRPLVGLTTVLSAFVLFWSSMRMRSSGEMGFGLTVVAAELVSYHLHVYDLTLLLLPMCLLLERAIASQGRRTWPLLLCGLFFATPLYLLLSRYRLTYLFCLPMLLLAFAISKASSLASQCP